MVGDFNPAAAISMVDNFFGNIPSQPAPPKVADRRAGTEGRTRGG